MPKIVDMEVKLDLNSPSAPPPQIKPELEPVNVDFNSSSVGKLQASASGKQSKRKLQVNDVVEVYFYHKDEVPSDDEPPVKSRRAKPNPETLLRLQREDEEDRQQAKEQFEAMFCHYYDKIKERIDDLAARDRKKSNCKLRRKYSYSDYEPVSEECRNPRELSFKKFVSPDHMSEPLTSASKLLSPSSSTSTPRRPNSDKLKVQRQLF